MNGAKAMVVCMLLFALPLVYQNLCSRWEHSLKPFKPSGVVTNALNSVAAYTDGGIALGMATYSSSNEDTWMSKFSGCLTVVATAVKGANKVVQNIAKIHTWDMYYKMRCILLPEEAQASCNAAATANARAEENRQRQSKAENTAYERCMELGATFTGKTQQIVIQLIGDLLLEHKCHLISIAVIVTLIILIFIQSSRPQILEFFEQRWLWAKMEFRRHVNWVMGSQFSNFLYNPYTAAFVKLLPFVGFVVLSMMLSGVSTCYAWVFAFTVVAVYCHTVRQYEPIVTADWTWVPLDVDVIHSHNWMMTLCVIIFIAVVCCTLTTLVNMAIIMCKAHAQFSNMLEIFPRVRCTATLAFNLVPDAVNAAETPVSALCHVFFNVFYLVTKD